MERWVTADLHLGHTNIIITYSGRPFRDADEMDDSIVERWNEVVAPTDRVLVLGDVAMGKIDRTLGVSARLHGYKVLLTGNQRPVRSAPRSQGRRMGRALPPRRWLRRDSPGSDAH